MTMRILAISNLYPPHYVGGYELGCRDVVESLERRGHAIKVLTSTYGVAGVEDDGRVYRWLSSELSWSCRPPSPAYWRAMFAKERHNRAMFKRMVTSWKPDIVYAWNMRSISLSIVLLAQQIGLPVCYYISDDWLAQLEAVDRWLQPARHPLKRLAKRLPELWLRATGMGIGAQPLQLRQVQFASEYLKCAATAAGREMMDARVIHWGIDMARFPYRAAGRHSARKLLYVGQLIPKKGVHTVVEAFKLLRQQHGFHDIELTIAGGTLAPAYEAQLKEQVRSSGLGDSVRFTGLLPRERLPALYRDHDILIFPSIWDEPFSITLLEAMSSGLAVVSTDTGGSPEILRHEENALLFPKEDARACARHIVRLIEQPDIWERIRASGRASVESEFQIERTIDRIEQALRSI